MIYFNNLKETNFHNIFCSNYLNFPNKVFVNDNWNVKIFLHHSYLFGEGDEHFHFMSKFQDFFRKMGDELYLASGKYHVTDDIYKAMYDPMLFESTMDITEIPYEVSDEVREGMDLNWCDDFIWSPEGKWGIYDSSYYFLSFLGYDPTLEEEINSFFKHQENPVSNDEFLAAIREECRFRKISPERETVILKEMSENNKWFCF